ncbi:MAG: heparinase II/III family protein [Candidatus Tectomicrobia bacterium]|nr:heparinase II/III family protein [Candidatus Tectomicrobia bacterium]
MKWLINRLLTMGPAEMASRLGDLGRHGLLRASLPHVQRRAKRPPLQAVAAVEPRELDALMQRICPEQRAPIMALADQWMTHHASFLGFEAVPLGDCINWHRDVATGVVGPLTYSGNLNYRDAAVAGDVKNIWELNRLHQLVILALAAVWSGEERYEQEIVAQLRSWRAHNPFMHGLNWKSPLEAAMRLISWALVVALLGRQDRIRTCFREEMRTTLYEHQYVLRAFFSKHSSANNHLIGEMAGLYVAAVCWPWYRESEAWRSFARQSLIREMARQVEPDGAGKERATEYQLFIIEFFLLAGTLGHAIGEPFPPEYWERLRRMVAALAAMTDRVGHLPLFGDGDGGQVVWLPEALEARTETLVRLGGGTAARPSSGVETPDLHAALWLWGQAPEDIPLAPIKLSRQRLHALSQGGYYVLSAERDSEDEWVVVVDAAPHGLAPLYAHAHADALSFWLSYGGREFVVDPGTYCYYGRDAWRSYFRSTAAHNTVRIDGAEQSVANGRFLWSQVAHCQVERAQETEASVELEAWHDGYQRLSDPVTHRRRLCLSKTAGALVITDQLECQDQHQVELFFHFSERCQVAPIEPALFEIDNGGRRLRLQVDARLTPELYHGSEQPIAGWVSRHFGVKTPAFTLVARGDIMGSAQFCSWISAP